MRFNAIPIKNKHSHRGFSDGVLDEFHFIYIFVYFFFFSRTNMKISGKMVLEENYGEADDPKNDMSFLKYNPTIHFLIIS